MIITSAPRTATVGALLAVAAGLIAPNNLIAFYLTALAAAVLLFAAFLAYLDAAERLDARSGLAVTTAGLGAALVMADAAIRFPAVLGELVWRQADDAAPLRERLRPVRQLLHR